jgi:erythromycin esterase-like protein
MTLLTLLAVEATPLGRLVDYGGLGIFLAVALYAIKALWGRDDRRNEQRDTQLENSLKRYQEVLAKLDTLQDLRVAETKKYAEDTLNAARENLRVVHQNETTASQVTEWMERLESRFEKYHNDMMSLVQALYSKGGESRESHPTGQ